MDSSAPSRNIALPDEAATLALGAQLAALFKPGDVVTLSGELGAGKTSLARGAVRALCGAVEVPSPTFTLVQIYEPQAFELWHADLYRLEDESEILELGLEEAFDHAVCLIEWAERLGTRLPPARLDVKLSFAEDGGRIAALEPRGDEWGQRLEQL